LHTKHAKREYPGPLMMPLTRAAPTRTSHMLRSGAQGAPTLVARRHLSNWPAEVLVRPSSGSSRPGSVISECLPHADWTGRESEGRQAAPPPTSSAQQQYKYGYSPRLMQRSMCARLRSG
jgi:hypothetical protein